MARSSEDSTSCDDDQIADRLVDESDALVSCAKWLEALVAGNTPVVNLRPEEDWPATDNVVVDQDRIVRVLRRIASDIDELARARRIKDMSSSTVDADPRLCRRRRLGEAPIEAPTGPMSVPQLHRAWDEYERKLNRAGLLIPANPFRYFDRSGK